MYVLKNAKCCIVANIFSYLVLTGNENLERKILKVIQDHISASIYISLPC